ncbi:hypothetical protein GGF31_004675 [Allomyces arbusculus]|nr:hypothetical protein GGF31_004675 [Allomyces arbusculus]
MQQLANEIGTKYVTFIRFNPSGFVDEEGVSITSCFGPDSEGRMRVRPSQVDEWDARLAAVETLFASMLVETPEAALNVHYFFYDGTPAPSVVTPKRNGENKSSPVGSTSATRAALAREVVTLDDDDDDDHDEDGGRVPEPRAPKLNVIVLDDDDSDFENLPVVKRRARAGKVWSGPSKVVESRAAASRSPVTSPTQARVNKTASGTGAVAPLGSAVLHAARAKGGKGEAAGAKGPV